MRDPSAGASERAAEPRRTGHRTAPEPPSPARALPEDHWEGLRALAPGDRNVAGGGEAERLPSDLQQGLRALGRGVRKIAARELSEPWVFAGLFNPRQDYVWTRLQTRIYPCQREVHPELTGEVKAHSERLLRQDRPHEVRKTSGLFRATALNDFPLPLPATALNLQEGVFGRLTGDVVYEHLYAQELAPDGIHPIEERPSLPPPLTAGRADAMHPGERFTLMGRIFGILNLHASAGPTAPVGPCVAGAALNLQGTGLKRWIYTLCIEKLTGGKVQVSVEPIGDFMGEWGVSATVGLQDYPAPNPYGLLAQMAEGAVWKHGYDRCSLFVTTLLKLIVYRQPVRTRQTSAIDRYIFDFSDRSSRKAFNRFFKLSAEDIAPAGRQRIGLTQTIIEKGALLGGQKLALAQDITERASGVIETPGGDRLEFDRSNHSKSWETIVGNERENNCLAYTVQKNGEAPRSVVEWFSHRMRLSTSEEKIRSFLDFAKAIGYQKLDRSNGPCEALPFSPTPSTPMRAFSLCRAAQQEDVHLSFLEEGIARIAGADHETAFNAYLHHALGLSPRMDIIAPRSVTEASFRETSLGLVLAYLAVEDEGPAGWLPDLSYEQKVGALEAQYAALHLRQGRPSAFPRSIARDAAMVRPLVDQAVRFARTTTALLPPGAPANLARRKEMERRFKDFSKLFGAEPLPAIAALVALAGRDSVRVHQLRLHAHDQVLAARPDGPVEEACRVVRTPKDEQWFYARAFMFPWEMYSVQPATCNARSPCTALGVPGEDPALSDHF